MCTAIAMKTRGLYFGRNLDLEYSLGEFVMVTPRNYTFEFRHANAQNSHYAMIGIGTAEEGYPLYYDAVNERGLCMAGLNFPGNAVYNAGRIGKLNIASFELMPYLLGACASVSEAEILLRDMNITSDSFSDRLPPTPLHWMLCDSQRCIVLEPMRDGLKIHEDPIGILTNSPPFEYHMQNLANYINLTPEIPRTRFSDRFSLSAYSNGMGAIGLPGDLSSASRFVRAAFTALNSVSGESEEESVGQFFHILGTVAQTAGTVRLGDGKLERTVYSSCADTNKLIYYYTTYENSSISAVDMKREKLDSRELVLYPLVCEQRIYAQN